MTDLDTGPSSIRDDSICESSLPPNKSSGDIVERLRDELLKWWSFDELQHHTHSWHTRTDFIFTELPKIVAPFAAEIERLRRENKQCLELLEQQAAQITDGRTIYDAANRRALSAESAVAAAWDCIEKLEGGHQLLLAAVKAGDPLNEIVWRIEEELRVIARASAIRAAVSKKTAESGHSPSTHNSESE